MPLSVYLLLLVTGGLAGFFVVPMNALLQHRGHVLLSAGHSIAVQNFNEQLNILLMVAMYTLLLWLQLPINIIIVMFGTVVAVLMVVFMRWCKRNLQANPELQEQIGQEGHGRALGSNPPEAPLALPLRRCCGPAEPAPRGLDWGGSVGGRACLWGGPCHAYWPALALQRGSAHWARMMAARRALRLNRRNQTARGCASVQAGGQLQVLPGADFSTGLRSR